MREKTTRGKEWHVFTCLGAKRDCGRDRERKTRWSAES